MGPTLQFETFSYLPALSDDDIKKQIGYMLRKGLTPCLEFDCAERSFAKEQPAYGPGFYYNRYWMMWKLPMFGCTDGDQVLKEVAACKKDYPDHYPRRRLQRREAGADGLLHRPQAGVSSRRRSTTCSICTTYGDLRRRARPAPRWP